TIYYPGFTLCGFAEPASILSTAVLFLMTPPQKVSFILILMSLISLVALHAIFWLRTQPVNRYWLLREELSEARTTFLAGKKHQLPSRSDLFAHWMNLRDQWEKSHVIRAILAMLAFSLIVTAITFNI